MFLKCFSNLVKQAGCVLLLALPVTAFSAEYPDPERFAEAIQAFAEQDSNVRPPPGAIVATGSSSMRFWAPEIHSDLAPLTIVARGFGGSNMNDVLHYLDELVLQYQPRAVMLYEGDNDVALGIEPAVILDRFQKIIKGIEGFDKEIRVYVFSVKPSPSRWDMWPQMQEVNRLLIAECEKNPALTYVDVATPMLNEAGEPFPDIFVEDRLHMKPSGYDIWSKAVRPVLIDGELSEEWKQ